MRCEYCGRPIKPGEWQCPGCGAPVSGEARQKADEDKTQEKQYKAYEQQQTYEQPKNEQQSYYESQSNNQRQQSYYEPQNNNQRQQSYYEEQKQNYKSHDHLYQKYGEYTLGREAYGGFIARSIAYVIDLFAISIIACIPVVGWIGAIAYLLLGDSEVWNGQTLGKVIMGLQVVDMDYDTISVKRTFWRNICKGILIFCFVGFGCITLFFSSRRRTLHDFFAGTCVIKTR